MSIDLNPPTATTTGAGAGVLRAARSRGAVGSKATGALPP